MENKTFQLSTLSAAIASTLISNYAIAQEPLLEEVIVTATRRAESIQDIPLNITALGSDMIQRERIGDLTELARRVPGMSVVDQGSRAADTITVRGLNVDATSPTDGENDGGDSVGTYIGEIPYYLDIRLTDMERVEVLIGPQGTLYGAGTLTGAVRNIPNRPQADEFTLQVRGDVFDLDESDDFGYDGGFTINVPLMEDMLALRASVDYYDDPGFIDYNYLVREAGVSMPQPDFTDPAAVQANLMRQKDANDEQTLSGRVGLRYMNDMLTADLTYYYQDTESGARQINHRAAFGTGKYESAHRFVEPLERENELFALELVADLGCAELTSATGFGMYDEDGQRDQTDLLLTFEYGYELFPAFAAFTHDIAEEDTFTQELRLVSTGDGPFNWIVGGFYNEFKLDSLSQEFTPGFDQFAIDEFGAEGSLRPDSLEYYEVREQETTEKAIFGELGYQITDAWQITIGARWFEFEDEQIGGFALPLLDTVFDGAPPDLIDVDLQENKVEDDDVIYKINTSYNITDTIMVYFTRSGGYRLGGLNAVPECPPNLDPREQNVCALEDEILIKSDTTINWEFGWRSQFSDNLTLNGALYFIEWEDVQVADITANGDIPITTNGGSAESQGVELSMQYFVTPDFSLSGSYAYNKAELTEDAPGLVDGFDAFDGDRLPGSPEHQYFLAASYSMPCDDGSEVVLDWSMTGQSNSITKVGKRADGESLDGYSIHNVSASWISDNLTLSLYADNLFNEYATTGVRRDRSFIRMVDQFDLRRYYNDVLRPRQMGLRVVYNFGD